MTGFLLNTSYRGRSEVIRGCQLIENKLKVLNMVVGKGDDKGMVFSKIV